MSSPAKAFIQYLESLEQRITALEESATSPATTDTSDEPDTPDETEEKPAPKKRGRPKGSKNKAPAKKGAAKKPAERNVAQEIREWMAARKAEGKPAVKYVRAALDEMELENASAVPEDQIDDFLERLDALAEEDA